MKTPTEVMADAGSCALRLQHSNPDEHATTYDNLVSAYLEGYRAALRESSGLIGEAIYKFGEAPSETTVPAIDYRQQITTTATPPNQLVTKV